MENAEILDRVSIARALKISRESVVNMNLMLVKIMSVKMELNVLIMDPLTPVTAHLATREKIVKKISSIVKTTHALQVLLASILIKDISVNVASI